MKHIKLTTGEYLLVEVPEDAHSCEIYANNVIGGWCIMYLRGNPDYACEYSPNLPPGQWEIIGKGNELTEDNWDEIIESKWDDYADGFWWKIYDSDQDEWGMCPSESGLSLIKSHSMNPETTLVIRKIK